MQVYVPVELYRRVKARSDVLSVSRILQRALEEALAGIERQEARAVEPARGGAVDREATRRRRRRRREEAA